MPSVYHIKNAPKGAIYIGRPSAWGNPFVLGKHGDRTAVVSKFRCYAEQKLRDDPHWLEPLRGKDVACYCAPLACHGDVLVELANISQEIT